MTGRKNYSKAPLFICLKRSDGALLVRHNKLSIGQWL
jgi:hypothetical protein